MTDLKTLKEITHPFSATDFGLLEGATIPNPVAMQEVVDLYNRSGLKRDQIIDLKGMASGEVVRLFLREEAKKWIKALEEDDEAYLKPEIYGIETADSDGVVGAIQWIKHFFNITEEELK